MVCMRIDTFQTCAQYGSIAVEQSLFLMFLITVQDCSPVDNVLGHLCLMMVFSAGGAQLPVSKEWVPDHEILTCL